MQNLPECSLNFPLFSLANQEQCGGINDWKRRTVLVTVPGFILPSLLELQGTLGTGDTGLGSIDLKGIFVVKKINQKPKACLAAEVVHIVEWASGFMMHSTHR